MRARQRGVSLVEILIVVAIGALLLGGAVYGVRALAKSDLRSSSLKLAGMIRYAFDRSITTGEYFRIVLDLTQSRFWLERSPTRAYLARDKERSPGGGKAFDQEAEERRLDEEERKREEREAARQPAKGLFGANMDALLYSEPPPKPKRAKFQTFTDAVLKLKGEVKTGRARLADVYTPRQREPYTSGRAYLYFFPDGHTERALIHLRDGNDWYSLIVHPLTGRVEVKSGFVELPSDFDNKDFVR
jgi:general secretion pathway protein H